MKADGDDGAALLADIGATNARFALLRGGRFGAPLYLAVADYATAYDAVAAALERLGAETTPPSAVLAFAGPVDSGRAVMTNAGWETTAAELRRRFGFSRLRLLNDYAALALSLERFGEGDTLAIGGADAVAGAPLAVLGPGSGLGVAALIPAEPYPLPLISEGGHATLSAGNDDEAALLAVLRRDFGHVSAERLLSGPGLVNLYQGLAALLGQPAEPLDPPAVTRRGLDGGDALCRQALHYFCGLLGGFAGDVALSFAARGGVFLGGGILPRFPGFLAASAFRDRFEDKGRFRDYLAAIPTRLITRPDAAFLGLAAAAAQLSDSRAAPGR